MPNAGFATRPILEKELHRFNQQHPNLEVKLTVIPWSKAWQKLMLATKKTADTEKLPDVIQIGSTWQGTLSYLGGLKELSSYVRPPMLDDFIEPLMNSCYATHTKKIFAIPWFSDVRVLYYRKDILKKLQIDPDELNSWETFRRALDKIKSRMGRKIAPMCLSGQSEGILMHDIAPWIWSAGSDFISLGRESLLHHEKSLKAIDFYFGLIHNGYIPLLGRDRITTGNFFSGDSVFQISGTWPLNSVFNNKSNEYHKDVAMNFGVAPFPSESSDSLYKTFIGGSHLAMTASCKNPEEAWSLIQFFTERENQESFVKKVGVLPSRRSSFNPSLFGPGSEGAETVFTESIAHAQTFPPLPVLGTVEQLILSFTEEVLRTLRTGTYSREHLAQIAEKTSDEINYILSLYA